MRFLESPHADARPAGMDVELIVLHAISLPAGEFSCEHVEALFMGRLEAAAHPSFAALHRLRVSAHFVVDRDGGLTQFVPTSLRAWHAGPSCWEGRESCNDFSIGIEMIGDELHPFTPAQYTQTARLCRALMATYPRILPDHIVGHADIAPGRKWDPGRQWDWSRFHRSLTHIRRLDLEVRR
jgi:Negative regulator of beta-lactamase expression